MWIEFRPRTCGGVGSHCGLLDEDPLCVKGGVGFFYFSSDRAMVLVAVRVGGFGMQLPLCVIG